MCVRVFVCVCVCAGGYTCVFHTEVHVDGAWPLRIGHVLVNGVQYLLLHLGDGVTVEHLDGNLWTVLVVGVHTVQGLDCTDGEEGEREKRQKNNHRRK